VSCPQVSVIMPARNAAVFIGEAVRSAVSQTFADFEIILVDDHSSDESLSRALAEGDSRILCLSSAGTGVAAARNTGIRASRGEYLAFLDADDVWYPDYLQRQITALAGDPAVDLCFAAAEWMDEAGRPLGRTIQRCSGTFSYEELLVEYLPVTASAWVVRRSAAERAGLFDESLTAGSDHDLCLMVALLRPGNARAVPYRLLRYRRRPGQITADRERKLHFWHQLAAKHRTVSPRATEALLRRATANLHRALAALAFDDGQYAEARQRFAEALRLQGPSLFNDRRTWITAVALTATWLPPAVRRPVLSAGRSLLGDREKA
jgi:glycosyltransferase involved in cell wall biosynthesis